MEKRKVLVMKIEQHPQSNATVSPCRLSTFTWHNLTVSAFVCTANKNKGKVSRKLNSLATPRKMVDISKCLRNLNTDISGSKKH